MDVLLLLFFVVAVLLNLNAVQGFVPLPETIANKPKRCLLVRRSHKQPTTAEVQCEEGPFHPSKLAGYWGKQPLLIRNAFDPTTLIASKAWPNWDDIFSWASHDYFDDDDEFEKSVMSRLVRRESKELDSFTLELGPFERSYLEELGSTTNSGDEDSWTLLLNDVDRIHPPLNDWIGQVFGPDYFPRWRLDDGQISIARRGGGIGPHVDNYDVFLIQTAGSREWLLGDAISTEQEMESLIDGLEVRILELDDNDKPKSKVIMTAGDLLYLPPRVIHHGSALSDDCMTLSVGCRAPSATELVSRVAEHLSYSFAPAAVRRYTDDDLLENPKTSTDEGGASITQQVRNDMKNLVLEAVKSVLDDPVAWDEIVGCLTTEPKRPTDTFSIYEDDEAEASPLEHVQEALVDGLGALWPTEGISLATSQLEDGEHHRYRIFADGQMFEWMTPKAQPDDIILSEKIILSVKQCVPLTKELLGGFHPSGDSMAALGDLLQRGFYYFDDEEAEQEP